MLSNTNRHSHFYDSPLLVEQELEKTSSGETGSNTTPYVHSVQDLALEQSVLAETTANGSVLALCGRYVCTSMTMCYAIK